jgi:hypothetical protein
VTTLSRPSPNVLEKDAVRIAKQPNGRLLVIATAMHFDLDVDDTLLIAALARTTGKELPDG